MQASRKHSLILRSPSRLFPIVIGLSTCRHKKRTVEALGVSVVFGSKAVNSVDLETRLITPATVAGPAGVGFCGGKRRDRRNRPLLALVMRQICRSFQSKPLHIKSWLSAIGQ